MNEVKEIILKIESPCTACVKKDVCKHTERVEKWISSHDTEVIPDVISKVNLICSCKSSICAYR